MVTNALLVLNAMFESAVDADLDKLKRKAVSSDVDGIRFRYNKE
ncbi:MAG: hypothetical protein ABI378_11580 [Chitinophagaceae bacterium]